MDQQTFQTTVFVHKDKLFRLAKRLLISQDEAFDAVQDVLVKLWQMKDELHRYSNIEAFAMQCIKNVCFNRLKHAEVAEQQRETVIRQKTEVFTPDNTNEVILEMINALPQKQQMVIHLRDVEEYEISEIAEIMEIEENAVRINLMRARQKLKVQLEKLFEYEQRQN
ncbi:sigma-70 family RNA polymerase sigma factor [Crocinitomicaceae bacterium CZZ-1]|uniref:Sigma-70 family RNA polymerase sigma factor n=1 Tax=Taishania pollutisoli TaxID=2766479 RepID=A0A8J6U256_9FLAO|nr:sigma-70 family RNA polymerase sigma factor [Taishania pollutisoli]MBC9812205.1 sigma-70 family RNA polymerase sigma factor [Taishania pollutisoli]MBX2950578.1 sigma-70 family RNA polymerase sigma factor [Crocinitomicaceae bacterium]NGF74657.1 sigma-70 family RNA polymerase sigma factor [Fluviicola sp. SGL-29]